MKPAKNLDVCGNRLFHLKKNIQCTHEVCSQTYSWGASVPLLWTSGGPTLVYGSINQIIYSVHPPYFNFRTPSPHILISGAPLPQM